MASILDIGQNSENIGKKIVYPVCSDGETVIKPENGEEKILSLSLLSAVINQTCNHVSKKENQGQLAVCKHGPFSKFGIVLFRLDLAIISSPGLLNGR